MLIILFRHGAAGDRDPSAWPDDDARPLTTRGGERTAVAARGIRRLAGTLDLVATSPLVRARQTAERLADAMRLPDVEVIEDLRPGGDAEGVFHWLASLAPDTRVAIVGHEPDLGRLAGRMALGPDVALPLKKAGACALRFEETPAPGTGRLVWLVPPRLLRRLGRRKAKV